MGKMSLVESRQSCRYYNTLIVEIYQGFVKVVRVHLEKSIIHERRVREREIRDCWWLEVRNT